MAKALRGLLGLFACLCVGPIAFGQTNKLQELLKKDGYSQVKLLESDNGRAFYVRAKLDGHECNLLVDTGAGDFYIKRPIAEKLGIKLDSRLPNFDKAGSGIRSNIVGYGTGKKLELGDGGYTINERFLVIGSDGFEYPVTVNDEKTKEQKTINLDGLIGLSLLMDHQFVLDGRTANLYLKSYSCEVLAKIAGTWKSTFMEQDERKVTAQASLKIDKDGKTEFSFREANIKGSLRLVKYGEIDLFYVSKLNSDVQSDYVLKGISRLKDDVLELCLIDEDSFIAQDGLWHNEKIFPLEFRSKKKMPIVHYKMQRIKSDQAEPEETKRPIIVKASDK